MRMRSLLSRLAAAVALFAGMSEAGSAAGLGDINHIIVIYLENRTFDNLYGAFPGADGRANAGASATQVDRDGKPYAKLPQPFGFSIDYTDGAMNLRSYYPDFAAVDAHGVRWLLETKGAEYDDVAYKDIAASNWCENATQLSGVTWKYLKIPQKAFEMLQPSRLEHLLALRASNLF